MLNRKIITCPYVHAYKYNYLLLVPPEHSLILQALIMQCLHLIEIIVTYDEMQVSVCYFSMRVYHTLSLLLF